MEKIIDDSKLYELLLEDKKHTEDKRDSINSYYIILLTGIIGILPLISDIANSINTTKDNTYIMKLASIVIEALGFALSIIWTLSLKRILFYLETLDELIENIEKKYNIIYTTYIKQKSQATQSPSRVTKYQQKLPYIFTLVFFICFIYSVVLIISHANKN